MGESLIMKPEVPRFPHRAINGLGNRGFGLLPAKVLSRSGRVYGS